MNGIKYVSWRIFATNLMHRFFIFVFIEKKNIEILHNLTRYELPENYFYFGLL